MHILSVYIFQVGVNKQLCIAYHVGAEGGICMLAPL